MLRRLWLVPVLCAAIAQPAMAQSQITTGSSRRRRRRQRAVLRVSSSRPHVTPTSCARRDGPRDGSPCWRCRRALHGEFKLSGFATCPEEFAHGRPIREAQRAMKLSGVAETLTVTRRPRRSRVEHGVEHHAQPAHHRDHPIWAASSRTCWASPGCQRVQGRTGRDQLAASAASSQHQSRRRLQQRVFGEQMAGSAGHRLTLDAVKEFR